MYCPEANTPTPSGPLCFKAFLIWISISSNARFHETGANLPFLSNSPFAFTRRSGCFNLSAPYIIFALKYPLIQLSPLFTGAAGSPLTATIFPSFVAIMIPHPVPQNLQAALSHLHPACAVFDAACKVAGTVIPTAAAAEAAAELFKKSLLESAILFSFFEMYLTFKF